MALLLPFADTVQIRTRVCLRPTIPRRAASGLQKTRYLVNHVYYNGCLTAFLVVPQVHLMDPVEKVKGMCCFLDLIGESGINGYGKAHFLNPELLG